MFHAELVMRMLGSPPETSQNWMLARFRTRRRRLRRRRRMRRARSRRWNQLHWEKPMQPAPGPDRLLDPASQFAERRVGTGTAALSKPAPLKPPGAAEFGCSSGGGDGPSREMPKHICA